MWGRQQARAISGHRATYDPLLVFSRDLRPRYLDGKPADLAWLEQREAELGISIQRMLASERHQLAGKTYGQLMRMAEVALREIGDALDRIKPDFILSEDISCFHSYAHFALACERGIPFWSITTARVAGPDLHLLRRLSTQRARRRALSTVVRARAVAGRARNSERLRHDVPRAPSQAQRNGGPREARRHRRRRRPALRSRRRVTSATAATPPCARPSR